MIFPGLGQSGDKGPTATKPMSRSSVQGGLRRAVKRAGLAGRKITLHTLRHSYATHLLEANVTIRTVQEYLGHATLQHTVRYLHITKQGREQACLTINIIMGDI
ncbi:hypothetical protein BVY04_04565 [bacterium M21]|nr:hypothetical protein BVY04_04565 [bacterium M21]